MLKKDPPVSNQLEVLQDDPYTQEDIMGHGMKVLSEVGESEEEDYLWDDFSDSESSQDEDMPVLMVAPPPPTSQDFAMAIDEYQKAFQEEYMDRTFLVENIPVTTTEYQLIQHCIPNNLIRFVRWRTHKNEPLLQLSQAKKDPFVNAVVVFVNRFKGKQRRIFISRNKYQGRIIRISQMYEQVKRDPEKIYADVMKGRDKVMLPFLPKDEPRTLFVRGMAKITLKKSILDVLLPFGLIEGIHWVPDKYLPNTEDKFTNAYVVFCDAKSAVAAYMGWDRFIFNRKTRVTWGRFRSMSARQSVRVHNISDLATEDDFREVFQTVTKVMYVNIETSKKGHRVVIATFSTMACATRALELHGTWVKGKQITVLKCEGDNSEQTITRQELAKKRFDEGPPEDQLMLVEAPKTGWVSYG